MTKSKSSESSIIFPLTLAIHLVNGENFLNATFTEVAIVTVIPPLTKM